MDLAQYTVPSAIPPSTSFPVRPDFGATQPNPFASSLNRDALLSYAYHLYDSRKDASHGLTHQPLFEPLPIPQTPAELYKARLLPLLITLKSLHPTYIPILLLLACTYHALGNFEESLHVNYEILKLHPHYAEAMCNIGTTLRMLGRNEEAFEWWWKALRTRPTYWDAMDNLIGLLFSLTHTVPGGPQRDSLYSRALEICRFVENHTMDSRGRLKMPLPPSELHRLQRVFFTAASLIMLSSNDLPKAAKEYFKAIELVTRPPLPNTDDELYNVRELILAVYVIGLGMSFGSDGSLPREIWDTLHLDGDTPLAARLTDPNFNIFHVVRAAGSPLVDALLRYGSGALPFLLLLPDQVARLPSFLFPSSGGALPGICVRNPEDGRLQVPSEDALQKTNLMTSTILLTLAKRYQDLKSSNVVVPGFTGSLNVNHSLCILFYYLSISLVPSPSTYNNMGIILATVAAVREYVDDLGHRQILNGPTLAKVYYESGLHLDSSHPHLLTNLGSLYKDQGLSDKAVQLYLKAVAAKPDFDVALANLGNAVKDTGRSWEAIDYYRRALSVNPDLPEAVCGLVSSMTSICDWRGRGGLATEVSVDDKGNLIQPGSPSEPPRPGYFTRMIEMTEKQINQGYLQNKRILTSAASVQEWLDVVTRAYGRRLHQFEYDQWSAMFSQFSQTHEANPAEDFINEGGFVLRFLHWLQPRLQRRWYISVYGKLYSSNRPVGRVPSRDNDRYTIPMVPKVMTPPSIPSVLPFNTFTYPLSPRLIRLIAHRHSLRISYAALTQPWLPRHVYPPPIPPLNGKLKIAYVSNDVNNHPLSHLMYSVFGMHDRSHFTVYLYTTSAWDGTEYRPKIAREVEHFVDASTWSTEQIVSDIVKRQVHILVNLGGYTKGARNDVFAARPCPIQMQLIGYPGTLGAGWCDYLVCDPIACPPELSAAERWLTIQRGSPESTGPLHIAPAANSPLDIGADLDPETKSEEWVYMEKFLYIPHTFMVTDHKQSFRLDDGYSPEERVHVPVTKLWADEELRRFELRKSTFPDVPQDYFIFANFNQSHSLNPQEIFAVWLRILTRVPRSILWLLRFPGAGEEHIVRTARQWVGDEVASRVRFGDVAPKDDHILRGRVADLFLDTAECNAHTVTADVLWSGTPILTWPRHKYKMSSRVAASMANATGFGDQMVVHSLKEYEERAVAFALNLQYEHKQTSSGHIIVKAEGPIINLRRNLFLNRDKMPLFDTRRWVRNIEKGYVEAWRRWVDGTQYELSDEWNQSQGPEKQSSCIWVEDNDPVEIVQYDQ
ncbi:TPR-like protein [Panus rudis PR-1116 ss-1]|nr:TPR-like protein [Panus rudis PR-1116 ss-1]